MEWFGLSLTIRSSRPIEADWIPNAAELHGKSMARGVMQKKEEWLLLDRKAKGDLITIMSRRLKWPIAKVALRTTWWRAVSLAR